MDKWSIISPKRYHDFITLKQAEIGLSRAVDIREKTRKIVRILKTHRSFLDLVADVPVKKKTAYQVALEPILCVDHLFQTEFVKKSNFFAPLAYISGSKVREMDALFSSQDVASNHGQVSVISSELLHPSFDYHFRYHLQLSQNVQEQLHFSDLFWSTRSLPKEASRVEKAKEIKEELQALRLQLIEWRSQGPGLLNKIRSLSRELYNLMKDSVRQYKRLLRSGRKLLLELFKSKLPRRAKKTILFILFKIFDDFSGSEEDEADLKRRSGLCHVFKIKKRHYNGKSKETFREITADHIGPRKQPYRRAA